ncbi:MAG TPA: ELWxxDGT repeat protein [Chitinophagales bacterium]|nr:ELWxxDGT repeat protein [Chitinophagales bacterium]
MKKYLPALLLLTVTSQFYLQAQTLYPISEGINPTIWNVSSVSKLREHFYFFKGYNPNTGYEPYVTDGTQIGTHLLQDINPGTESSLATGFFRINDTVCIFPANDGNNNYGTELWRSNGTSSGTYMVADLNPGSASSIYLYFSRVQLNGQNFFSNIYDSILTLYITDGSPVGTIPLLTGTEPFDPVQIDFLASVNDIMYFYTHGINTGTSLWRTNGTPNGTFELIDVNTFANYNKSAVLGNSFIFSASDSIHGEELWITDGTVVGTTLLKDIVPGPIGSSPQYFTSVSGKILFDADDSSMTSKLWVTDGTDTGTYQLPSSGAVQLYQTPDSNVYFAQTDSVENLSLWKSDGTIAGTSMVHSFSCSDCSFNFAHLNPIVEVSGLSYFALLRNADLNDYWSIWVTDGTDSGTVEVYAYPDSTLYPIYQFTDACAEVFFSVNLSTWHHEYHLWKVELDTAFDLNLFPIYYANDIKFYFEDDGEIYFTSRDSMWSLQLYKLQVCPATTIQNISVINSPSLFPNPNNGLFTLELPDNLSHAEVRVTDMMGKCRYANKISASNDSKLNLQLENIPPGIYSLQISSSEHRWQQFFIKQ